MDANDTMKLKERTLNRIYALIAALWLSAAFVCAQAQVSLTAKANPQADYEAFDSIITLTIVNTEPNDITLLTLNVNERDTGLQPL